MTQIFSRVITSATNDDGTLKDTDNQGDVNRHPENLQFTKLSYEISFLLIDSINTQICPFSFFIRLHNESKSVTKPGTTTNIDLDTFHGPSDWATSTDQTVIDGVINNPSSIGQTFYLLPPTIISDTTADAILEITKCVNVLENIACLATWNPITISMFNQCCPNLAHDPVTVIQACH